MWVPTLEEQVDFWADFFHSFCFDFGERKPGVRTLISCGIGKRLVPKRAEGLEDPTEYRISCCLLL